MAVKIVLTPTDLSEEDFVINNGKIHAVHIKQEYQVVLSKHFATVGNNPNLRKIVRLLNGQGFIHLDIRRKNDSAAGWVGTLPPECPTPTHLVEEVVPGLADDGVTAVPPCTIYIDKGSRNIMSINTKPGVRYVANLSLMVV